MKPGSRGVKVWRAGSARQDTWLDFEERVGSPGEGDFCPSSSSLLLAEKIKSASSRETAQAGRILPAKVSFSFFDSLCDLGQSFTSLNPVFIGYVSKGSGLS